MRINLTISDDLYDRLRRRVDAKEGEKAPVQRFIKDLLEEFVDVGADGPYYVVRGENRAEVEKLAQTTVRTPEELVRHLRHLSQVGIGEVIRPLTPEESMVLTENASFWGVSPKERMEQVLNEVIEESLGRA